MSIREFAEQAGYKVLPTVRLAFQGFNKEKFAELVAAHEREELLNIVYGYANHLRNDEAFQAAIKLR